MSGYKQNQGHIIRGELWWCVVQYTHPLLDSTISTGFNLVLMFAMASAAAETTAVLRPTICLDMCLAVLCSYFS